MLVVDYLNFAVNGEIKPLTMADIGGETPNSVQSKNRETLIGYLNLANIEIHKKFALIQKEFILEDVENNKYFDLPIDFMYASSASYEDGTQVSLNNERLCMDGKNVDQCVSVMFPEQFKALTKGTDRLGRDRISLICVVAPDKVTSIDGFVDISHVFTDCILNYMAYKAYASMQGDIQATNNTYYLRFLESCKTVVTDGLITSDNLDSNVKLNMRGFV